MRTDVSLDGIRIAYSDLRDLAVNAVFSKLHQVREIMEGLVPDMISTKDDEELREWTRHSYASLMGHGNLLGEYERVLKTANAVFYGSIRDKIEIVKEGKSETDEVE